MLLMIFVNDFWTLKNIPNWLKHAPADFDGMGFSFILITFIFALLGFVWWMEESIYNSPRIPQTETERKVVDIKERIKVAEWKLKKLVGEQ